jgi:hypothetical protein
VAGRPDTDTDRMTSKCLDQARLLSELAAAQLVSLPGGIRIVATSSYGYVVRGACPPCLVEELLLFSGEHEDDFYAVHGKLANSIGRMLLRVSPEHRRRLAEHGELAALSEDTRAEVLAEQLGLVWERTRQLVIASKAEDCGSMNEVEIARSLPGSLGQLRHLDQLENSWSQMLCMGQPGEFVEGTLYCEYPYQKWPMNMSGQTTMPTDWERLPHAYVQWQVGDILVGRQNHIHCAPPNRSPSEYRFLAFMGGSAAPGSLTSQSDATVWTETRFWKNWRYCKRDGCVVVWCSWGCAVLFRSVHFVWLCVFLCLFF